MIGQEMIDGHNHRTALKDAQKTGNEFSAVIHPDRHAITRLYPVVIDQMRGYLPGKA
jgi:hypothetical protein